MGLGGQKSNNIGMRTAASKRFHSCVECQRPSLHYECQVYLTTEGPITTLKCMVNTAKSSSRPVGAASVIGFVLAAVSGIIVFNLESPPSWIPGAIAGVVLISVAGIIASVVASVPRKDREGVEWQALLHGAAVASVVAVFGGFAYAFLEAILDLPRLSAGVFGIAIGMVWLVAALVIHAERRG